MSGLAGLLRHDGRPVDPLLLGRMAASLGTRGPDPVATIAEGPLGLVDSRRGAPPLSRDPRSGVLLAFDGRLDDREEIEPLLDRWGEEAPARLRGDFSLAAWDPRRRRLLLARDAMGARPLFYAPTRDVLVFGSSLAVLLESPEVPPRPNEGWIAEYLARAVTHPAETIYDGVFRLPAGHLLIATEGRISVRRFWYPRPMEVDGSPERLRELLDDAVSVRLRDAGPVGIDCSGGIDSSSVLATARPLAPDALAQSVVYPGLSCDESEWQRAVTGAVGGPAAAYEGSEATLEEFASQARRHRHLPGDPVSLSARPLLEDSRRRGIRVRLGGEGGDERFGGDRGHGADLLRAGRFVAAMREGSPWAEGIRPLLPEGAVRFARRLRGTPPAPPWMRADLARRVALADRVRDVPRRGEWPTHAQGWLAGSLASGTAALVVEEWDRQAADHGIEMRHPFQDRRVVEWALSIPREGRLGKEMLRRAMQGRLPAMVLGRRTRAEFSPLHLGALRRLGGPSLFDRLAVEEEGWVEGPATRALAARVLGTVAAPEAEARRGALVLWSVFALDLWFRIGRPGGDSP